jgi:TRAP-type C4-dicarboxylate transport system substrate-binding protein
VLASAAGTSLAGPPSKTGSTVTLTLADTENRGHPASMIAEAFAARVNTLSRGTVAVNIVYQAGKTSVDIPVAQLESALIGLVRRGDAELAIVPTRALAAHGVKSLAALQAPLLITTQSAMADVTTGRIAAKLQSGLPSLGLTGLGLAPEGLRRVFWFSKPRVSLRDFQGLKVRSYPARPIWELYRSLGATPVDVNGTSFDRAVQSGTIEATESSLAIVADGGLPKPATTTGNVVIYPKLDALVANSRALERLTGEQRSILQTAAMDARRWAVRSLTESRARDAFCRQGGTVVEAPSIWIATLRAKAAPVVASMRADPLTRSLIDEIAPFGGAAGAPLASCSHTAAAAPSSGITVDAVLPAGVYRLAVTEKQLLAAGSTPRDAKGNAGTTTFTVTKDGYLTVSVDSPYPEYTTTCDKQKMTLRGGLVLVSLHGGGSCGGDFRVGWRLVPGGIEFTRVEPSDPILNLMYAGVVWKRAR